MPQGRVSCFLILGECSGVSRVRVAEWLRWFAKFANHFGGVDCRGEEQYLDFAPGSLKVAVGLFCFFAFFFFLIFSYLIIQSLPQPCMELFLVSYSFLVFCGSKSYLSRCKPCSTAAKGPRSQVPGPRSHPISNSSSSPLITEPWGSRRAGGGEAFLGSLVLKILKGTLVDALMWCYVKFCLSHLNYYLIKKCLI